MIEYANELIDEIKANKPSDATSITVAGVPIKDVRYTGSGLEIFIDDTEFVEKSEYDCLEDELDCLREEYEDLEYSMEYLEDDVENYEKALGEIRDIVFEKSDEIEEFDKILGIINKVRK